jgi:hypothetical protein
MDTFINIFLILPVRSSSKTIITNIHSKISLSGVVRMRRYNIASFLAYRVLPHAGPFCIAHLFAWLFLNRGAASPLSSFVLSLSLFLYPFYFVLPVFGVCGQLYRRIIVCWHRQIGRRMAVCARQPCICAGSIRLCAWILHLCGLKHRAQIQKWLCTNRVTWWPQTKKKIPKWFQTAQTKKRYAQGFSAFDTAETAADSKHGAPPLFPAFLSFFEMKFN